MNPLRCAIPAFFLLLQVLPFSPHQKLQRIAQPENTIASQFIVGFDDDLVSNATAAALGLMADCCDSEGLIIQFLESAWKAFVVRNLTDVSLSRILDYPIVQSVEQDHTAALANLQVHDNPPWGLDRLDQRRLPLDKSYCGIRPTHIDFHGRVSCGLNLVPDETCEDLHGHGTHVAGIAAGQTHGVAKEANLISVKVFNRHGVALISQLLGAVEFVIRSRSLRGNGTAVVNLSVGTAKSWSLNWAIEKASKEGLVFVVGGGNNGGNACSYSPSSAEAAITVGATTIADNRASFSNIGPCLDIFAPGETILSASHTSDTATATKSGTSMATAFVSGAAALYIEQNRSLNAFEIKSSILESTVPGIVRDLPEFLATPNRLVNVRDLVPIEFEHEEGSHFLLWIRRAAITTATLLTILLVFGLRRRRFNRRKRQGTSEIREESSSFP